MRNMLSVKVGLLLPLVVSTVSGEMTREAKFANLESERLLGKSKSRSKDWRKRTSSKSSSKSKTKGKGGWSKSKEPSFTETIYETVEFEVDGRVCGLLSDVKSDIEAAFLAFFEKEDNCSSDRGVQSVVLVEFEEADTCSDEGEESKSKSKGGKSRSKSKSKGKGKGSNSKDYRETALEGRQLQNRDSKSKGKLNKKSGCNDCDRRRLAVVRDLGRSSKSRSKCSPDLAEELQDVGFDGARSAAVTKVKEIDCSSKSHKCRSTKSKNGACCGFDGCACNTPSESLCEAEGCCIEGARNYHPDFCSDYCDTSVCRPDVSSDYYVYF